MATADSSGRGVRGGRRQQLEEGEKKERALGGFGSGGEASSRGLDLGEEDDLMADEGAWVESGGRLVGGVKRRVEAEGGSHGGL